MNSSELVDRTGEAEAVVRKELGDLRVLGVTPGTGWNGGIDAAFKPRLAIPYAGMRVPGADLEVEGHSKGLTVGEIDGRDVVLLGRVHPNEDCTDPDMRQAMSVVIGSLRENLDGLLITNGVGTLHGKVGREKGLVHSLVQTALLDVTGWAFRGRKQEHIGVGDIALVDDVKTGLVGSFTPLGAGEFPDFYYNGIHRDSNFYFDLARNIIQQVQGRCPIAQSRFIAGPQFEGPADKREFRGVGDDIIGMSGIGEILECTKQGVPFAQMVLATNGPFEKHSHEGNQDAGRRNTEKAAAILKVTAREWPIKYKG